MARLQRMRGERGARSAILVVLLTSAIGIVVNYSTSQTPGLIAENIWIAWALLCGFAVALVGVEILPLKRGSDDYEPNSTILLRYTRKIEDIDNLPVSRKLRIRSLQYGEGPQQVKIEDFQESELSDDWRLTTAESPWPDDVQPIQLPHRFVVTGSKSVGKAVAIHLVTDLAYVQAARALQLGSTFLARCKLDRGGILPFVDIDAYHKGRIVVRSETGAQAAIVAVEYFNGRPTARSRYLFVIRVGIRYPDDIWASKRTGSAILSTKNRDDARMAFQSRQQGGLASDVFACDVDGGRMVNLTEKTASSYDGFFRGTEEVVKWIDRNHLRVASHLASQNGVKIVRDPES